ncbi:MAG TPA: response regulator receiver protein [Xanthobacteraceae bacterium]|nr:response regulator receiver protein [Xanthobacteraceae bacterium]
MKTGVPGSGAAQAQVVVITADPGFAEQARATFGASAQIAVQVIPGTLASAENEIDAQTTTVAVIDLDAAPAEELAALERLMAREGGLPVVPVIRAVDASLARTLVQMRVADFLVKPVSAAELVRTCARVAQGPQVSGAAAPNEAQIYTFLPAVGGAGVTTLAIASAMILLESSPRGKSSTCLVDLDFQHGSCADYLDIEPRLNLAEIEPRPDRLDRQLLEVMLSHHASGLAVIAAPHHLAEMRSFDPDVVTRLLDLVSSNFDYVVFDMPRTWFSWTDSVLLGSNHLYVVCEMTVPGLRHAKRLVEAIQERLGEGPKPQVVVNRFEQRMFSSGLRRTDVQQVLGESFAACVPNQYGLVREAIDRGVPLDEVKPGNKVTLALKRLILPPAVAKAAARGDTAAPRKVLSWAR